ncbi:MAG TPA: RNA polymerase sigma factor [Solirubrobacteraceae bacterium]|jgi:RNA polymerase sigma-70 factor (ECF subfamily)|nr:RNA polymerase sigma factor [Solirubrobacteraceae bacterium]
MGGFLEDPAAFSRFYRAESRGLLVFFARRTLDAQVALDLTAETFAQAFAGRRSFRGRTDAEAGGWIFAIGRRQLARYFEAGAAERRMLERVGVEVPSAASTELERIDELAGLDVLRGVVREQLDVLDGGQRDALRLRVVDEHPYSLVAAALGISEHAARMRVSRALRSLAGALDGLPGATGGTSR